MTDKKIIALNRMYAGSYIEDETNIGHEIINLFKTDNGDNFIYLQPHGNYDRKQAGRFETILLVRGIGNDILEVLGKAEELTHLPVLSECCGGKRYDKKAVAQTHIHSKQKEVVEEYSIYYGGVSIDKLYSKNKYDDVCIYATFKADKVRLPKKALYITDDKDKASADKNIHFVSTKNGFAKQNLKMYFEEETAGYVSIKNILDDETLWAENDTTEKIGDKLYLGDEETSFLDIIKKNDDELVFSNLIAHYLSKYKPLMQKFIERFCELNLNGKINVYREKYHIDILLQDEYGNSVIIENKIRSGINGIVFGSNGQIEKNQLKTYVETLIKEENREQNKIQGLIFVPNYYKIDFSKYEYSDLYKIVTYRQLFEFFKEYIFGIDDFGISDPYYADFVKALKLHSKDVDNTLQEDMKRRFIKSILNNR